MTQAEARRDFCDGFHPAYELVIDMFRSAQRELYHGSYSNRQPRLNYNFSKTR